MVTTEAEPTVVSTTGPSPPGAALRIGMFGGGTVGGGVYEICEQVRITRVSCPPTVVDIHNTVYKKKGCET